MELGATTKTWLKAVHIFFSCAWLGAVLSTGLLHMLMARPGAVENLYPVTTAMQLLDVYVIVPASLGCLVTGVAFCAFTKWGFTKFYWVAFKWLITILQILVGTVFMSPWLSTMILIAKDNDSNLINSQYILLYDLNTYLGAAQALLLVVLVLVSVFKPWGKIRVNKTVTDGTRVITGKFLPPHIPGGEDAGI